MFIDLKLATIDDKEDKMIREIKENNDNNEWRHQRPISSGSIERYPDVAVDLWNMGTGRYGMH